MKKYKNLIDSLLYIIIGILLPKLYFKLVELYELFY
jgi:hypothetical protein